MSGELEVGQGQRAGPTCSLCGRRLGVGFYYTCHACGRNYCYAHIPSKCTHRSIERPRAPIPAKISR